MNIYISHSTHYDFKRKLYKPIKESGITQEFDVIFPHEDSEEIFDIRGALERGEIDLIIADITYPSTGQGIELAWAHSYGVPIECIFLVDSYVSPTLQLLTNKQFDYETEEDMIDMIKVILLGQIHADETNEKDLN
jgi:hypothetical protein